MDTVIKETFKVILTYEMSVNIDTGEILNSKLISREIDNSDLNQKKSQKSISKKAQSMDSDPTLMLSDSKYTLNQSAVNLMDLIPGDKLSIKYENSIPIIGKDDIFGIKGGNKLTKSFTVSYRGVKNEELSKYGNEFKIQKHATKDGLFILVNDLVNINSKEEDSTENLDINTEEINSDELFDFRIDKLIEDSDVSIESVDSNMFQL